jgi:hypothetical protein
MATCAQSLRPSRLLAMWSAQPADLASNMGEAGRPGTGGAVMRPWMIAAAALILAILSEGARMPVAASEAVQCAAIADRSARLQCFTAVPEIQARVGRVVDGDTLDICIGASCIRVRLCGIDAPERGERGYSEATDALRSLVSRETVSWVRTKRTDARVRGRKFAHLASCAGDHYNRLGPWCDGAMWALMPPRRHCPALSGSPRQHFQPVR